MHKQHLSNSRRVQSVFPPTESARKSYSRLHNRPSGFNSDAMQSKLTTHSARTRSNYVLSLQLQLTEQLTHLTAVIPGVGHATTALRAGVCSGLFCSGPSCSGLLFGLLVFHPVMQRAKLNRPPPTLAVNLCVNPTDL